MARSLYVHVPFCEQICHYCDFNKFYLKNQPIREYLSLCVEEMKQTISRFPANETISTIYIGGGTPTSLSSDELAYLFENIRKVFPLENDLEWTVEVNPGSADKEKLAVLKENGVNRLSIGAQTFDSDLLKAINRDHMPEDIEKTVKLSNDVGIDNLSIDLMFGLPEQSMEQWKATLKSACDLSIQHISAYGLKVEKKTVFYQLQKKDKLSLPSEDLEASMYEYMIDFLEKNEFVQYEISNFSKSQKQSEHNLTYWNNKEYYGIGAGAHSYLEGVRRANHGPLPKYMNSLKEKKLPFFEEHQVTREEMMEEQMFMGLRKLEGVSFKEFVGRFGKEIQEIFPNVIDPLISRKLIEKKNHHIRLTPKGLLLGNEVFEKFLLND